MAHPARSPSRARWCLLWLLVSPPLATAQAPEPSPLPAADLRRAEALAAELAQARAPAGARVVAQAGRPDPRLRLAPCGETSVQPSPGAPAWGRTRVLVRCAAGPVAWKVTLPLSVQVWAPAWVARGPLPAGSALGAEALEVALVDWAAGAATPLPPEAEPAGRVLARAVTAGEPLTPANLRARQWFAAGDTVLVTARGPGYAVRGEAQAIGAGLEGQGVRLRSANGRVFVAVPVGERRAEVAL